MAFRRINFFKGFFTRADDWQAAEAYHREKRKLHNTSLHTAGIVSGLEVKAADSGRAVMITPGYAVDPEGSDVVLERDTSIALAFEEYARRTEASTTVYVTLESSESPVDFRQDTANPEYSGHAFVEESSKVRVAVEAPHERNAILLATIKLGKGATKIQDANQAGNPGENEIDLRGRVRAGAVGARFKLAEIGERVASGELDVVPMDADSVNYEASVSWLGVGDRHSFHLASVYPLPGHEGHVSWRLGSVRRGQKVEYKLFLRNHEERTVRVAFRVYRVD